MAVFLHQHIDYREKREWWSERRAVLVRAAETIDEVMDRGWAVGTATYSVLSGPPVAAVFTTSPRRLLAGTTVQLSGGVPIAAPIDVELVDAFGNVAASSWAVHTVYAKSTESATTRGGVDPLQPAADGPSWPVIGPSDTPLAVDIPQGQTRARFYIWDTRAGTTTIQAALVRQDGYAPAPVLQSQRITPGPADYFTIHQPFLMANPLKVSTPGLLARDLGGGRVLGVTARDRFGNVAAGDPVNGQYFAGLVRFSVSGDTTAATLTDLTASTDVPSAYWFRGAADVQPGIFNALQLVSSLAQELRVWATAQAEPGVYGFTDDAGRAHTTPPVTPDGFSDDDVFIGGVVAAGLDLASGTLTTGDGTTAAAPDPVALQRLTLQLQPPAAVWTADLSRLRVAKLGALAAAHVTELALYHDEDGDGLFGPGTDVFVASAAWTGSEWRFGDPAYGRAPL
ncbi:MAG: hypothetical protein UY87_C0016G0035, partial [Candidatus Peribacteria bacterium GW2011_GWC2_54_8]